VQRSKTAPKGAAIFIADCLARDSYLLTNNNGLDTTAELLGVDDAQAVAKLVGDLAANGDGRAQVISRLWPTHASRAKKSRLAGAVLQGAMRPREAPPQWSAALRAGGHHNMEASMLLASGNAA
jgi:hypothetical protein